MSVTAACRHLDRTLSELAAEYGRLEVVREPREVTPDEYDRLHERASVLDGCGGAGAWLYDPDGRVLLVDGEEGWEEPGAPRRPGDDYRECAERAVRERTGIDPQLADVRHVHVRYCHDWTDRDPIPQPFVVFTGTATGDPGPEATWHADPPGELLYELLRESV
ncbi:NUDIX domain-containing protein [Halorarius halobius]|uniref:NUDIX domain-containing protein n=1 Tax=Halorarius halobius TaxID=2962671 RepID=UPI0020CCEC77|nr:NUDIX hydrolase [Halorarius halobius]